MARHRSKLDWNDLHLAVVLAESRTLSAAARKLGVNQSTASRRLVALEASVGAALFLRSAQGYVATAAGERLLSRVRELATQIEGLERSVSIAEHEVRGVVRVALTEISASQLLEHTIGALAERYPELVVELVVSYGRADLSRGEADIAVRMVAPETADLARKKAGTMQFGLYAARDYIARRGAPKHRDDLRCFDVIVGCRDLASGPEARWLGDDLRGARPAVRVSSMRVIARACAEGHGLAVLSNMTASAEEKLALVHEIPEIPTRDVWLVSHRDTRAVARVRAVSDAIYDDLRARLRRGR
ncbi:MAG: LysR family transcriptional regulator [Deltaproteobacteria bacterium]|nr:LysR family transcriptional regulator [Deltaproteobacteria bacterium]